MKSMTRQELENLMAEIETERFGHPVRLVGLSQKSKAEVAEIVDAMRVARLLYRWVERNRPSLTTTLFPSSAEADRLQHWGRVYRYADNLMSGHSKSVAKQRAGNY